MRGLYGLLIMENGIEIKWQGDKKYGTEIRYSNGEIDEVLMWRDGDCVMHLERMDDNSIWIGLHEKRSTTHIDLNSKEDIAINKR